MNTEQQANEHHWQVLVTLLKNIAKEKNITYQQIADTTGLQQPNVARIFSLKYCPSLRNFIAIARALKANFFIESDDSDSELNVAFEKTMEEMGRRPGRLPKN